MILLKILSLCLIFFENYVCISIGGTWVWNKQYFEKWPFVVSIQQIEGAGVKLTCRIFGIYDKKSTCYPSHATKISKD